MNDLIPSAVKVSIVILVALSACLALRGRSAALRHWVLAIAVASALAMPLLSQVLPPWASAPFWRSSAAADHEAETRDGGSASRGIVPSPGTSTRTEFFISPESRSQFASVDTDDIAYAIWLSGGFVSLLLVLVGLARLWWLASRARAVDNETWLEICERLRRSYGLAAPVRLLQSDLSSLLVTWGWRRPTVLLPSVSREWSDDRVTVVLAHELAHVARGDWAVQLAAEALRTIYWFNPVLWIACRRLRLESERACDDAVLAGGIEGPEYAEHLLAVARSVTSGRQRWLPAPAMARPSSLEGRILAMLNPTINRRPVSGPSRVATVGALLVLTVFLAGLQAQSQYYSLKGAVLDPTERLLPKTKMVLTNQTTKAKYEVQTDDTGRFEFLGLLPAQYTLRASLAGFASLEEEITIAGNTEHDMKLSVGSLEETITVSDRKEPDAPPDAATLQKREEARRRFSEVRQREQARCASGGADSIEGGRILPPAKLRNVAPVYPEHLSAARVGGTVTMNAVIGTDGMVRDIQNLEGPHPDLEAAAADAVRQWQFSPTLLNCEPIDVHMRVTTNFSVQP